MEEEEETGETSSLTRKVLSSHPMISMGPIVLHPLIEKVQRVFLSCTSFERLPPLLPLKDNVNLQRAVIDSTINHVRNIRHSVRIAYQCKFLKFIIDYLEGIGSPIINDIYNTYCKLLLLKQDERSYKHYHIDSHYISIAESVYFLSDGTTGLVTWEAALVFAEWMVKHISCVQNKRILELGSGCGLVGCVAALVCKAKTFIFSDYHKTVLENLWHNVCINIPQHIRDAGDVCVHTINWDLADEAYLRTHFSDVDTLLATDIIYDSVLFAPMIKVLHCLQRVCHWKEFILACTERDPNTLNTFLQMLRDHKFEITEVEDVPIHNQQYFYCDIISNMAIRIFRIRHSHKFATTQETNAEFAVPSIPPKAR